MSKQIIQRFKLTEDHLKLLQHSWIGWNDCELGGFEQDTVHPYGYREDVCMMHKVLTGTEAKEGDLWKATLDYYTQLHREGAKALSIVLQTRSFIPGVYERPYGADGRWKLVDCQSIDCAGDGTTHDHNPNCSFMKELTSDLDTAPRWRSVDDLPELTSEEEEDEIRCVVVWQDADYAEDKGVETTNLTCIRCGDFDSPQYKNAEWCSLMDAKAFEKSAEEEEEEEEEE